MSDGHLCEDIPECPLCLEPFALDDINFYPCACRYQICRFCWHRIRTDENGLCPHCREPYSENPAEYTPPTQDQLVKLKHDKKQKTHDKKQKLIESRKNLSSLRVVQKNLVFVIGLSPRLAEPDTLRKNEYFGKYGKIYKVVINNSTVYNGAQGPSVSAYVTYYREEDAYKAIQAVNNAFIDGRHLKASYGTTKYCTYFLRGSQCTKPDCMYLHEIGNEEASFTKEDMQAGKHQVFETQVAAAQPGGGREQGGQGSSSNQLVKGAKELDIESALPATASWGMRQGGGGGGGPPLTTKDTKTSGRHGKSQKSKRKSLDGSSSKSGSRGPRSDPVSPHSGSDSGTTRRHNSTGSRMDAGSSGTRSASITRSNSTAASSSSKSVSPNLSPKSSLSTSTSSGSLQQDGEGARGGGGEGINFESPGEEVETVPGKPHPLESAVSRQLDSIDLDEVDDWGIQEVRASVAQGTVSMATNPAKQQTGVGGVSDKRNAVNVLSSLGSAATGQFGSLGVSWNSGAPPPSLPSHCPVPVGQSSVGVTAQRQRPMERKQTPDDDLGFDPWDVSTRGLAALLETEQRPPHPKPPTTSSSPSSSSFSSSSYSAVNGVGGRGGLGSAVTLDSSTNLPWQDELKSVFPNVNISFGVPSSAMTAVPQPVAPTTTSTSSSTTPSVFPSSLSSLSSSSSIPQSQQTPLQQAINGATQSLSFPYHHIGVGGMGGLFGYATPAQLQAMSEYRSLYEATALSSQTSLAAARTAFETPKIPPTTSVSSTPSSLLSSSSSSTNPPNTANSSTNISCPFSSIPGTQGPPGGGLVGPGRINGALQHGKTFPGAANMIDWPELSSSSQPAVGSKRGGGAGGGGGGGKTNVPTATTTASAVGVSTGTTGGPASTTGTVGSGVLLNSNVGTWNGSMGNGGMGNGTGTAKDSTTAAGGTSTPATAARSKDSATGGIVAPPPGFASKSGKDANMTLNSSVNHALWNTNIGKAGGGAGTGQQGPNPAMASQILQNWAKYLQMNFGGLTPQQLAANPLYQQMVRQQQHYWAMLRQQQLLHLHQAAATAGVSTTVPGRPVLTPAQLQQLQARMALSQSILNQATAHARLQQQQQFLQQTLQQSQQQQQQQARNGLGQVGGGGGVPTTAAVPVVSGASSTVGLGQAVRLGQIQLTPGAAVPPGSGVLLKPSSQSGRVLLPQQQQSQKVPSK